MDIYLAGSNGRHDLVALAVEGNIQKYIRGGQMDIYLAGENGKGRILNAFIRGGYDINDVSPEEILNMEIYLAGGVSGNLSPEWRKVSEKLRGGQNATDLYLSGNGAWIYPSNGSKLLSPTGANQFCVLESFYYTSADDILIPLIPYFKKFMLDSGAFSFMQGNGGKPNFDEYLERYITFINQNKVDLFFELDIDSVVGYEKVKEYRRRLEKGTGKQCIPVWHKSRGKQEFLKMCEEYSYVAIGGIVSKEITPQEYKYFPWFINEAHKRNAKIHGLGFTNTASLSKYHFDSVDSSSWTTGNRFGAIYKFDGKKLLKIDRPPGTRVKHKETAVNNFVEWVKFANWAENHL